MDTNKIVIIMEEMRNTIKEFINDIGWCDHSVGICCCKEYNILENADKVIKELKNE